MFVKVDVRNRYDDLKNQAREIANDALPSYLKNLSLESIGSKAVISSKSWGVNTDRMVDWDWSFSKSYCSRYPKSFDLAIWNKNTLLSLSLGRPTYMGKSIRLDFIERTPNTDLYSGQIFTIARISYETYGRLIGADFIRIMEPMNDKLIAYYTSPDKRFKLVPALLDAPHYLIKKL